MANCCATVYIIHGYSSTLCHGNNLKKDQVDKFRQIQSLDCSGRVSADTLLAVHRLQPIPLGIFTCNFLLTQNHRMSKGYLTLPHESIDSETVLVYHISVFSAVVSTMTNLRILPLHKVSLNAKKFIKTPIRGVKICKHRDIKVTFFSLYFCVYVRIIKGLQYARAIKSMKPLRVFLFPSLLLPTHRKEASRCKSHFFLIVLLCVRTYC